VLKNLILACASVVASLAGVEIALRMVDLYAPMSYPPEARWTDVYTSHPAYGYALHPTNTVAFDFPHKTPRTLTIHSNSDGFRQRRELEEEDERIHILVTGDSYTFGQGVEESERFTDRVEALRPDLRVDNIAMTGWGLDMMVLALEAVVPRTRPDIVVVALFYDDFRRVRTRFAGVGFPIPRFILQGDELVLRPYPRPRLYERLHLYQAYNRALRGPDRPMAGPSKTEWRINDRLLDRVHELSQTYGFRTVLVYLPSRWTGRVDDNRRRWTRREAERQGFAVVDSIYEIQRDSVNAFIRYDGHYSPRGHEIVARAILPVLDSLSEVVRPR